MQKNYEITSKETLQEENRQLQNFLEDLGPSFVAYRHTIDGTLEYVSHNFENLFGSPLEEVMNKKFHEAIHWTGDSVQKALVAIESTFNNEKFYHNLTLSFIHNKTKKERYLDVNWHAVRDADGNVLSCEGIVQDITEKHELEQEIINTQKELLNNLVELIESRSKETSDHVKRVGEYSALLAKLCGLTKNEINILREAAPMHDIGKIGIPDSILLKNGHLTDKEYESMKTHTTIGYLVFKNSERELLKAAAIITHEHHEKWDGTGYPKGLVGEDIHIYGRIVALADVFDALSNDRYYKKAWEEETVLKYLKKERGKQFDPKLIDLFFEHIDEFKKIKDRFK